MSKSDDQICCRPLAIDWPMAVVRHYDVGLGVDFEPDQQADLVAFLEAL